MKKGSKIALVSPASPVSAAEAEAAALALQSVGFRVTLGASAYAANDYLSGADATRAKDLNDAFTDETISGVYCLRGGYGTQRILDMLDYAAIRANPKFFGGYSDVSALHAAFYQRCGLRTYHMPMAAKWAAGVDDYTAAYARSCLFEDVRGPLTNPGGAPLSAVNPGVGRGALVGGNLSVLAASLGTPYEIDTRGKVLFLEDVNEPPYKIDRALTQLRLAGKLSDCAAIVFGAFTDCDAPNGGRTVADVVADTVPSGVPCASGLACGHCLPTMSLPLGAIAELHADEGTLLIL